MKNIPLLFPKTQTVLSELGENIRYARLRRRWSVARVSERAGISRKTLYSIEHGSASVSMGSYMQVLFILGLEKDMAAVAANDPLGRLLQDAGIPTRKRAPKQK